MTYQEAIDFLYNLRLFGTKLGLENSYRLAELFGNPQDQLKFIHVAGTNGKGSTCAMLESIYRCAGLRVGLFTSPHLVSFTERIQVNCVPISELETAQLTEEMLKTLIEENGAKEDHNTWEFRPTFFEVVTVMGLRYFAEKKCEVVIWETGMGGRLDATNIVKPLAAVITNIQLDHQTWLGNTIEEIAREKAGIIKPNVPTITAASDEKALEVIADTAKKKESPLTVVDGAKVRAAAGFEVGLRGAHQLINAACALETVEELQRIIPVSTEAITKGLKEVKWPGRLQLVEREGTKVLLDGAHNPDGATTLRKSIESILGQGEVTLVLGLFRDKEWTKMCDILVPMAAKLYLVPVQSERTADPVEVGRYCKELSPGLEVKAWPTLSAGLDAALKDRVVAVTGSLHLVGEAMEHLGVSPSGRSERLLNEWTAVKPS